MRPVEIKAVAANDFDVWLPLWKAYQRFYEVDIAPAETAQAWARFLAPVEPMHAALAMDGGQAFGLVHSIYHRSAWTAADHCYLQDLFVTADARGRGIGRALIEHVYADAKRRGASRVYWLTHEINHAAMRLYDRIADAFALHPVPETVCLTARPRGALAGTRLKPWKYPNEHPPYRLQPASGIP